MSTDAAERAAAPRGRYAKTAETRARILKEAREVFAKSGYRAGSVAAIAANIGMTEAGISYHFPTKASLLAAVLDAHDAELREFLGPADDGIAFLQRTLDYIVGMREKSGLAELYTVLSAEAIDRSHPAHERFVRQRRESSRAAFRRAFRDIRRRDLLAPGTEPDLAADLVSAHIDGVQAQWLLDPQEVDMLAQAKLLYRQLIPAWDSLPQA